MKNNFLALIGATFLFSSICQANDGKSMCDISSSIGLINGSEFLACITAKQGPISAENPFPAIAVAVFESKHSENPTAQSAWISDLNPTTNTSVKIKNNSVYFSVHYSNGCCSDSFMQHQFKPVNGIFTLIGEESYSIGFEERTAKESGNPMTDNLVSYKSGRSINYLTNEISYWRVQRQSSSKDPFKDDFLTAKTPKSRVEKRLKLSHPTILPLNEIDLMQEWSSKPSEFRCYFDSSFKFTCL